MLPVFRMINHFVIVVMGVLEESIKFLMMFIFWGRETDNNKINDTSIAISVL